MTTRIDDPVELDSATLVGAYLSICNAAIDKNPDYPLFAYLREHGAGAFGVALGIAVYHDTVGTPFTHFTVTFQDGGFRLTDPGPEPVTLGWTVRRSDLERVVVDPRTYVDDPDRLEWHWLEVPLGFEHREAAIA